MGRPLVWRIVSSCVWSLVVCVAVGLFAERGGAEVATPLPAGDRGPEFFAAPSEAGGRLVRLDVARTVVLSQRIALDVRGVTIPAALAAIAAGSGLGFVYDRAVLSVGTRVTVTGAVTVAAALTRVLRGGNVDVELGGEGLVSIIARGVPPEPGAITGRVTDAKTGQGLAYASVLVEGVSRGATANDSGAYRVAGIAAGSYTLVVRMLGYVAVRRPVTVVAGQSTVVDVALDPSVNKLDQVVVAGTVVPTEVRAIPTPVSVITASDIELQQPQTLVQLYRQAVPSAVAWDYGTDPESTTMSIRGGSTFANGAGSLKVYLDGIEITDFTFAAIDPQSIDRIEIIRGPQAATIYGSDAIAGVMLVTTKRGSETPGRPEVELQVAAGVVQGPYGRQGGGAAARQEYSGSINGGTPSAGYNVGGGYASSGNWAPQAGTSVPSLYGGVHLAQGPFTISVTARDFVQHTGQAIPPDFESTGVSTFSKQPNRFATSDEQTYGAALTFAATNSWRHNLTVGVDRLGQDLRSAGPALTTPADTFLTIVESNESKTTVAYNTAITIPLGGASSTSVTAGIDHYALGNDLYLGTGATTINGTIATDPAQPLLAIHSPSTNTGVFAQTQLNLGSRLFLTAGVRAERNSNFGRGLGTPLSPRYGVSFTPVVGVTTVKLRASYGEAIRPPAPGEQDATVSAFQIQRANPTLQPERQRGWDTGVDMVIGGRFSMSATYYDQMASDLIEGVTPNIDTVPAILEFENVGRIRNRGLELDGTLHTLLGQLAAQYALGSSRVISLGPAFTGDLRVGDNLLAVPQQTGGASWAVTLLHATTVTFGLTYVGRWVNDDQIAELRCIAGTAPCPASNRGFWRTYPAFAKANLSITQQLARNVAGFVTVKNLTDNEQFEFDNGIIVTGRVTVAGVRIRY